MTNIDVRPTDASIKQYTRCLNRFSYKDIDGNVISEFGQDIVTSLFSLYITT